MSMVIWRKEVDELFNAGKFLADVGISNWALTRPQALSILSELRELRVPLLGGDVCELDAFGRILPNYDSWHCDRRENERLDEFLDRSLTEAKTYIEGYSYDVAPENIFFTLIPDV